MWVGNETGFAQRSSSLSFLLPKMQPHWQKLQRGPWDDLQDKSHQLTMGKQKKRRLNSWRLCGSTTTARPWIAHLQTSFRWKTNKQKNILFKPLFGESLLEPKGIPKWYSHKLVSQTQSVFKGKSLTKSCDLNKRARLFRREIEATGVDCQLLVYVHPDRFCYFL